MIHRLVLPLLATPLLAGEITIDKKPFSVEHRFSAIAIPGDAVAMKLEPLSWSDFTIESLVEHGSEVEKGDSLVRFEREAFDRRIEDAKRSVAVNELALATRRMTVDKLRQEQSLDLAAARKAKTAADEDLAYFKTTGRPAEEAVIAQRLKLQQFRLDSEKEELAQLQKMYEEDDLTEETEEIILTRQKFSVEDAEFDLREVERASELNLKTAIPRRAARLEEAAERAAIKLEKAEKEFPRALKSAELEMAGAKAALEREKLELERLKKDGDLLEWKAPIDGIFYYGSLEDGRWNLGELSKHLVEGGKCPPEKNLVSVIPANGQPPLNALVDGSLARSIPIDSKVVISLQGREDLVMTGNVSELAAVPGSNGKHLLTISLDWPEDFSPAAGSSADCIVVVHENADAISLPVKALKVDRDGAWSVGIKLADGKTERREVQRGRVSKDLVEILDGLEPGQVVIVPD